jgi:hypothetical protein
MKFKITYRVSTLGSNRASDSKVFTEEVNASSENEARSDFNRSWFGGPMEILKIGSGTPVSDPQPKGLAPGLKLIDPSKRKGAPTLKP